MAEDFEEQELIDRIRTWWSENGVSLVGTLVLVVGGWSGWNFYADYSQEQAEEAFAHLSEYVDLREAGEGESERAVELLALLDEDHEGSADQVLSLFYRASDAVQGEVFDAAQAELSRVLEDAPEAHLQDLARVRLSRVYIEQGEAQMALDLLAEIQGPGFLPMREELRGDAYWQIGEKQLARESYQAALEHEQGLSDSDTWPFLKMKIAGLDFSGYSQADDDAQAAAQTNGRHEVDEPKELVADTDAATHIEVALESSELLDEDGSVQDEGLGGVEE